MTNQTDQTDDQPADQPVARRIAAELAARRVQLELSYPALAARTGIDRHRLQRLLGTGSQQLKLDELIPLCEALEVPRGDLLRLAWLHRRPERLAAAGPGPASRPTADLARLLIGSPDWAFSVLPVYSGPSDSVRVHVIDRIAVTPRDPDAFPADHDELRREFLAEFRGLPAGVSFSVVDSRSTRRETIPHDPHGRHPFDRPYRALYLRSMVYAADRPVGPMPIELTGVSDGGVAVLGLRVATSSLDLAASIARGLGWGLVSTTRRGQQVSGYPAVDPRRSTHSANLYANYLLGEYLATGAPRTVVGHVGTPTADATGTPVDGYEVLDDPDSVVPYVVLVSESDAFLRWCLDQPVNARGDRSRFSFEELAGWRDRLRAAVERLQARGRATIVEHDPAWAHAPAMAVERLARLRWQATAQYARTALQELFHLSGLPGRATALRDPVVRDLLSYNSPFVWH